MGNNDKLEKVARIEKVLNTVLAKLFPVPEDETERINSARITCSRLKAFDRTILKSQTEFDPYASPQQHQAQNSQTKI